MRREKLCRRLFPFICSLLSTPDCILNCVNRFTSKNGPKHTLSLIICECDLACSIVLAKYLLSKNVQGLEKIFICSHNKSGFNRHSSATVEYAICRRVKLFISINKQKVIWSNNRVTSEEHTSFICKKENRDQHIDLCYLLSVFSDLSPISSHWIRIWIELLTQIIQNRPQYSFIADSLKCQLMA